MFLVFVLLYLPPSVPLINQLIDFFLLVMSVIFLVICMSGNFWLESRQSELWTLDFSVFL